MRHLSLLSGILLGTMLLVSCAANRKLNMAAQNAETVRLWFEEGWNKNRNEELLERVFSPNWEDGNPLRPDQTTGIEGMREFVAYYEKDASHSNRNIAFM